MPGTTACPLVFTKLVNSEVLGCFNEWKTRGYFLSHLHSAWVGGHVVYAGAFTRGSTAQEPPILGVTAADLMTKVASAREMGNEPLQVSVIDGHSLNIEDASGYPSEVVPLFTVLLQPPRADTKFELHPWLHIGTRDTQLLNLGYSLIDQVRYFNEADELMFAAVWQLDVPFEDAMQLTYSTYTTSSDLLTAVAQNGKPISVTGVVSEPGSSSTQTRSYMALFQWQQGKTTDEWSFDLTESGLLAMHSRQVAAGKQIRRIAIYRDLHNSNLPRYAATWTSSCNGAYTCPIGYTMEHAPSNGQASDGRCVKVVNVSETCVSPTEFQQDWYLDQDRCYYYDFSRFPPATYDYPAECPATPAGTVSSELMPQPGLDTCRIVRRPHCSITLPPISWPIRPVGWPSLGG